MKEFIQEMKGFIQWLCKPSQVVYLILFMLLSGEALAEVNYCAVSNEYRRACVDHAYYATNNIEWGRQKIYVKCCYDKESYNFPKPKVK